ncbi:MAG TPA: type IV pilus twitching motility protein PilT [bacterium (Candidatus Stahlbacteria)]|nr:type IV pilus twitching motility protein PilT [Candidatus Stahlbacteria bacterium]
MDPLPPLDVLLEELVLEEGSDLHLRVDEPPIIRVYGKLKRTEHPIINDEYITRIFMEITPDEKKELFKRTRELDLAYEVPGVARFRVNFFLQRGHLGCVMRMIPLKIKTIDEWGFPDIFKDFANMTRGLILVTGPTGSGKSTTLAAIIEEINSVRRSHIVTVEDPIEYLHRDKLSSIEQRELGIDTKSYGEALKHALRQNPDVILVGEMRDLETMALTLTAAETGHLVFSTLHTIDAVQSIDRIIDAFPPEQQQQIRIQLSMTLNAVVTETLVPRKDGTGRIAAFEIMIATPAVRNAIREKKVHQIYSFIQTGSRLGMIQMDQYLKNLYFQDMISFEEAMAHCNNPDEFEKLRKE